MPWCRKCLNDDGMEMRGQFREHILETANNIAMGIRSNATMIFPTPTEKNEEKQDYTVLEREIRKKFPK